MLYPQTHATGLNPNACWDWWGYDDAGLRHPDGRQMAAVDAMIDRLAGVTAGGRCRSAPGFGASNLGHWRAGRARVCNWWFLCAVGSGERLGLPASQLQHALRAPGRHLRHRRCRAAALSATHALANCVRGVVRPIVARRQRGRAMIVELGHVALILAFVVAIVQMVVPMVGAHRGWADWMRVAVPAALGAVRPDRSPRSWR